jgi:hypothetical protein
MRGSALAMQAFALRNSFSHGSLIEAPDADPWRIDADKRAQMVMAQTMQAAGFR